MRLAVFGATGRTGRPLVAQALAASHEVVAFARDPARLNIQHERLRIVQGTRPIQPQSNAPSMEPTR
jgi:putative NADH-flavin reductase